MSTPRAFIGSVSRFARAPFRPFWGRRRISVRTICSVCSVCLVGSVAGCGHANAPSPFVVAPDGGSEPGAVSDAAAARPPPAEDAATGDAAALDPSEWGGACLDDAECNDSVACTRDVCDPSRRLCHFIGEDSACDDGVFCNGVEQCLRGLGCRAGDPVTCSDGTACTIDSCDETTHQCAHVPRDADGDGDPDGNCPGGGDCNDSDPNISSKAKEICDNGIDDNCNGHVDEADCVSPKYDRCESPLEISASGTFSLSPVAAKLDYAASCAVKDSQSRDLVAAVVIPAGPKTDVDLVLTSAGGTVALAAATQCGDASTEISCDSGQGTLPGLARVRLRSLDAGTYPVYLFTDSTAALTLVADYLEPAPAPTNETCGTAAMIAPGVHAVASLAGATRDLVTACGTPNGDLFYEIDLDATEDLHVFAAAKDTYGTPIISLRDAACTATDSEIGCRSAANVELFRRALPKGKYFLGVGSTGPSDVDVVIETDPPTTPPADENCADAPQITPNVTTPISLANHVDDIQLGCSVGYPDAAYSLHLDAPSDVLLLESMTSGDPGAVSLAAPSCTVGIPLLACATSDSNLARASAANVPAGDYRVVVESNLADPVSVTALVRPTVPASLVPFSDVCASATEIPTAGGVFQGNTANANNDYLATCDVGGSKGAPDQVLHLHLDVPSRVILDGKGTAFSSIIDVRVGPGCPGDEVLGGCSAGYTRDRSFLDLPLGAGDYWVLIDGYQGASGPWTLNAYVIPD